MLLFFATKFAIKANLPPTATNDACDRHIRPNTTIFGTIHPTLALAFVVDLFSVLLLLVLAEITRKSHVSARRHENAFAPWFHTTNKMESTEMTIIFHFPLKLSTM